MDLNNISYGISIQDIIVTTDGLYYPDSGNAAHSWVFARRNGELLS